MATVAELLILVKMKNETSGEVAKVTKDLGGLKGMIGDVAKTAGGFIIGQAVIGGAKALVGQLGSVISEARAAREIMKQTEAVIKSTGGAAGLTAREIAKLATEQARQTNFTDDEVQSTANLLLTFTRINKDIFPETLSMAQDMSQALGQDLSASSMQLGKALNDPIAGVTALRKVGVLLTDQQRDQIKAFVESGDVLSAQKVILKELAVEFGGSAKAVADPLDEMGEQFGELKEGIGLAVLPLLMMFATVMVQHVVPAMQLGVQWFSDFVSLISAALSGDVGRAAELFGALPAPLQRLALWLAANKEEIAGFIAGVRDLIVQAALLALQFAVWTKESGLLSTLLTGLKTILEGIKAVIGLLAPLVSDIIEFFQEHEKAALALAIALGLVLAAMFPILAIIFVTGLLRNHWDDLKAKAAEIWNAVPAPIRIALELILALVTFYVSEVRNFVETNFAIMRDIVKIVMAVLSGDWGAAWRGMKDLVVDVIGGITGAIRPLIDLIQTLIDKINIIPSPGDIAGGIGGKVKGILGFTGGVRGFGGGLAIVGEGGPELVALPRGADVFSNSESRRMLRRGKRVVPAGENGKGGTTIINQYFYPREIILQGDPQAGLASIAEMYV